MPNASPTPDLFADRIRDLGERTPGGEASAKGALGQMQVLPGTAQAPGFGVRPADASDLNDLNRLGRDYAKALLSKYQSPALASAAYNAGPGRVDGWLRQFGDPRTGQISESDWLGKIPFGETRGYVQRVAGPAVTGATPRPVAVTNQLAPTPAAAAQAPPATPPPEPATAGANPAAALRLLQLLLPSTHSLAPVDYNPWALAPAARNV